MNAVASVVGQVLDYRLNCGPNGSYLNRGVSSLIAAKYQFLLCKPKKTPFTEDFDKAAEHLDHLQAAVASSQSRRNLFVVDMIGHNLHFSCNIFEKRVHYDLLYDYTN